MNKLIVIGWLSNKKCYLNISREEAIKRFCNYFIGIDEKYLEDNELINEYVFKDEFDAYDAWA